MKKNHRVILAEDNKLFADALELYLNQSEDIEVVKTCNTIRETISYCQNTAFDLLILDLSFKGKKSIDYLEQIKPKGAKFKIMCLTTYDNDFIKEEVMEKGVDAFCSKDTVLENLLDYIREVLSPNFTQTNTISKKEFSPRQLEIIKAYHKFNSDEEVSNYLHISKNTLKTHKRHLFEKTNCKNNLELLKFGIAEGIIVV